MKNYFVSFMFTTLEEGEPNSGFGHEVVSLRAPIATSDDVEDLIEILHARMDDDATVTDIIPLSIQPLPIV